MLAARSHSLGYCALAGDQESCAGTIFRRMNDAYAAKNPAAATEHSVSPDTSVAVLSEYRSTLSSSDMIGSAAAVGDRKLRIPKQPTRVSPRMMSYAVRLHRPSTTLRPPIPRGSARS